MHSFNTARLLASYGHEREKRGGVVIPRTGRRCDPRAAECEGMLLETDELANKVRVVEQGERAAL
jgi:hypothetical protein